MKRSPASVTNESARTMRASSGMEWREKQPHPTTEPVFSSQSPLRAFREFCINGAHFRLIAAVLVPSAPRGAHEGNPPHNASRCRKGDKERITGCIPEPHPRFPPLPPHPIPSPLSHVSADGKRTARRCVPHRPPQEQMASEDGVVPLRRTQGHSHLRSHADLCAPRTLRGGTEEAPGRRQDDPVRLDEAAEHPAD